MGAARRCRPGLSATERGTTTSAIWKITERPCRTILAPIFTNRSRSVVSDQCFTEIVGQRMQLQPNGIGGETMARQSRPYDCVLTLLDPLFGRPALIVKRHHPFGRGGQVGHYEAGARVELASVGAGGSGTTGLGV